MQAELDFSAKNPIEERDRALTQVAQHAEEKQPGFVEGAQQFVVAYLQGKQERRDSAENITDACLAAGWRPHDLRAFGAVYMGLARQGRIVKDGTCSRRLGHNTAGGNIWKLA